jgi:hypothetical protein
MTRPVSRPGRVTLGRSACRILQWPRFPQPPQNPA